MKVDSLPFICAPVLQLLSERLQKIKYCRQTSQSWYSRVKFHSFVIFNKSSTKISHLNADLSLSLFRSVLSSVLNFDTFWVNSSICLIFVNFRLARNGKIFFYVAGVFECLREANYREFCHPQGRSRGPSKQLQAIQHGEFSREHYVVVFSRISFSWVIHPLFALTWTSRDFLWIQNCRNGSFC